ncbi:hypothetical protein D9757_011773 [Collybiopsis confluens]|uniref:ATP-dependent DNA helicase n=1 Tax=Collybiopsis confluens TaxID=2823264 RepID=A0A8H5GHP5_9AGAR|nr:hypothetical protein D9757_011773 [Collybiopsis confluens]
MPKFALNNHLYRGELPDDLEDVTWAEEMACALYRTTAHVTRLFGSACSEDPLQLHGNVCAHPMDICLTAKRLPWAPTDINDLISIVFVGQKVLTKDEMLKLKPFIVRRHVIHRLLVHFYNHHSGYSALPPLDEEILLLYPESGLLPGLADRFLYDLQSCPNDVFQTESSGFDDHPASLLQGEEQTEAMLESSGIYDAESSDVPARFKIASVAHNIACSLPLTGDPLSDTILRYDRDPITEYNNPALFPGMFPTLFPLGIGGFEDPQQSPRVSLELHAEHLLDQSNRSFRYHYFFPFVALNIIQRRKSHLFTSLSVSSQKFSIIGPQLLSVTPGVLSSLAAHLKDEHSLSDMSFEQQKAYQLLQQVNFISAKIPGSQATKLSIRHQVTNYFAYFGLPHLWFTFNPSAVHSPVFQVFYGDTNVDLSERFPNILSPRAQRAIRLARDPVAAADFFDFMYHALFRDLFGWNFDTGKSTEQGGILGHIRAFYGCAELTDRGSFHGHYLIFLRGGLNPSETHRKMRADESYQLQFMTFFEDLIRYDLPNSNQVLDQSYEPRVEMPPDPPQMDSNNHYIPESVDDWQRLFDDEYKKIGEKFHRHRHQKVCYKGRPPGSDCRFGFPQDIVITSEFDSGSNSIVFARKECDVNGHHPVLVVLTRHNHDLTCILSGRAAKAAMFYISNYMLKMPLSTDELLSLLSKAVVSFSREDLNKDPSTASKRLLHRCLTHFGRKQQIHAQQCARYLRRLGDAMCSHSCIPLPSANLMKLVDDRYSSIKCDTSSEDIAEPELELPVSITSSGSLQQLDRVQEYWFRDSALLDMNFYDFVRHTSCQAKSNTRTVHTPETRVGVLSRFSLQELHPLHCSHEIIRHTFIAQGDAGKELVPVMIGMNPPRQSDSDYYKLFVLAHFKPFSFELSLIDSSLHDTYASLNLTAEYQRVVDNWEEIHECEDEREKERLKKRANALKNSLPFSTSDDGNIPIDDNDFDVDKDIDIIPQINSKLTESPSVLAYKLLKIDLTSALWLTPSSLHKSSSTSMHHTSPVELPLLSTVNIKHWSTQASQMNKCFAQARRQRKNIHQVISLPEGPTPSNLNFGQHDMPHLFSSLETKSVSNDHSSSSSQSLANIMDATAETFQLTSEQLIAFRMIALTIVNKDVFRLSDWINRDPLHMLLLGPGGTGKTHVVRAVQHVMDLYGLKHAYRSLAPTASAARLVDGTTIHSGCNVKVRSKGTMISAGANSPDLTVLATIKKSSVLREDWKDVLLLLIDEYSMIDQMLLANVDAALRYAKENNDQFLGALLSFIPVIRVNTLPSVAPLYIILSQALQTLFNHKMSYCDD